MEGKTKDGKPKQKAKVGAKREIKRVTFRSTKEEDNEKRANGADVPVSDGDDAVLGGETTYMDRN